MDQDQINRASEALLKYLAANRKPVSTSLLDDEDGPSETVYVVIATKKFVSDHKLLKPRRIPIPHSIFDKEATSVCVFVKDPQSSYEEALQAEESECQGLVDNVVALSRLKGKYKPYEARRQLFASHDVFVADKSIIDMLPKLLGKVFYGGSSSGLKMPLAIRTTNSAGQPSGTHVKRDLEQVLGSTVLTLTSGTVLSVRIGTDQSTGRQLTENAEAVVKYFVDKVAGDWSNIRSVHLKSRVSPSLPVYITDTAVDPEDLAEDGQVVEEPKKRKHDSDGLFAEAMEELLDEAELQEIRSRKKAKKVERKARREEVRKKDGVQREEGEEDEEEKIEEDEEEKIEKKEKIEDTEEKKEKKEKKAKKDKKNKKNKDTKAYKDDKKRKSEKK